MVKAYKKSSEVLPIHGVTDIFTVCILSGIGYRLASERGMSTEAGVMCEADDIATKMIGILVAKFKEREGRDPTADEAEQLLGELTEERVAELLGMELTESEQELSKEVEKNEVKAIFPFVQATPTPNSSGDSSSGSSSSSSSSSSRSSSSSSSSSSSHDDKEVEQAPSEEADVIASGIWKILTDKFKEKTGKDPSEEDLGKMLEEMTEERVAELLSEGSLGEEGNEDVEESPDKRKNSVAAGEKDEVDEEHSTRKKQKNAP